MGRMLWKDPLQSSMQLRSVTSRGGGSLWIVAESSSVGGGRPRPAHEDEAHVLWACPQWHGARDSWTRWLLTAAAAMP